MTELIRIDRNGTKYYKGLVPCSRCGGYGGADVWKATGWTCYKCGGSGKELGSWKEYTPEYMEKLTAQRERRRLKWEQEHAEEIAEREREKQRRLEEQAEALRKQQEAEEQERQRKARSQWVGEIGEKITTPAVMESHAWFEAPSFRGYGTDVITVYTFRDDNGNALVWKTSSGGLEFIEGKRVTVTGTVKDHNEYREEKQTQLKRVKVTE